MMKMWRRLGMLLAFAGCFGLTAGAAEIAVPGEVLAPGQGIAESTQHLWPGYGLFTYSYEDLYGGPQTVSILKVDLNDPALELGIGVCPDDNRQTVSALGKRYHALAAVNAGYFNFSPSSAVGLLKVNGEMLCDALGGVDSSGYLYFTGSRVGVATPEEVNTGLGDNMRWSFPLLVKDGEIYDRIGDYDHTLQRHNRTAVGVTADNQLFLVVFDGRTPGRAIGVTCPQLADFMKRLGCVDAINMDGGGSTTMWVESLGVVNHPTDNRKFDHAGERRVYDILYVRLKSAAELPLEPSAEEAPDSLDQTDPDNEAFTAAA
ncbi:phosphodiester glycosidase family protein [Victivallis sp. Marseille-Q1083]|uniref:phosphodiester glycosidase family protein n=1 Tax=Victivallis sp. Marseille-Q1083 TaxID=2717288 RepID=UPI00158C1C69|nr:phosphodiester glycosidase family protein [Victivallis sp. Marseille-Q1083]